TGSQTGRGRPEAEREDIGAIIAALGDAVRGYPRENAAVSEEPGAR
ncbi:MAG: hypothetical protein QOI91_1045, partial [Solirubrobacteraceae bacterium]|nr:hypothetical protein [Solirubrobacteraceae bacterium]